MSRSREDSSCAVPAAERTARLFRHQQAPHFTLRSEAAIEGALTAGACLHRDELVGTVQPAASRSNRGRKSQPQAELRLVEPRRLAA